MPKSGPFLNLLCVAVNVFQRQKKCDRNMDIMHTTSPDSVSDGTLGVANECNQWGVQWVEPISGAKQWDPWFFGSFSAAFRRHIGFVLICVIISFSAAFRRLFGGFSAPHIFDLLSWLIDTSRELSGELCMGAFRRHMEAFRRHSVWYQNALELCLYRIVQI